MEEYMGTIKLFSGDFSPRGYLECNGQLLPINQYQALFSILGNRHGGNYQSLTFALPKLTPPDESMKYIMCVDGIYPTRP